MPEKREKFTTFQIWAGTLVLIVLIIGGALVIRDKRSANIQPVPAPRMTELREPGAPVVPPETQQVPGKSDITEPEPADEVAEPVEPAAADINDPFQTGNLAGTLKLTVPVLWPDGSRLPLEYSCYRTNITPPVQWSGVPEGTKSLVLFMDKETGAKPYSYWVLFNIPPGQEGLAAKLPAGPELESGARYGRNDHGVIQYTGPCDPMGKIAYAFRLVALDIALALEAGADKTEILQAMTGHVLDIAELPFIHYLRF